MSSAPLVVRAVAFHRANATDPLQHFHTALADNRASLNDALAVPLRELIEAGYTVDNLLQIPLVPRKIDTRDLHTSPWKHEPQPI